MSHPLYICLFYVNFEATRKTKKILMHWATHYLSSIRSAELANQFFFANRVKKIMQYLFDFVPGPLVPTVNYDVNNPHCDGSPRVTGPRWLANYIVNEARYVSEETDSDVAERFRTCAATQTEDSPWVQPGDKRSRSGE